MSLQLLQQVIRGSGGAAGDLCVTTLDDLANLVHRHDLSAQNDGDLSSELVARQTL
jgi:hypothetical protein